MKKINFIKLIIILLGSFLIYSSNFTSGLLPVYSIFAVLISLLWTTDNTDTYKTLLPSLMLLLSVKFGEANLLYSLVFFEVALLSTYSRKEFLNNMFIISPTIIILFLITEHYFPTLKFNAVVFYSIYFFTRFVSINLSWGERYLKWSAYLVFLISISQFVIRNYSITNYIVIVMPLIWLMTLFDKKKEAVRFRISFLLIFCLAGLSSELLVVFLIVQYVIESIRERFNRFPFLILLIFVFSKYLMPLNIEKLSLYSLILFIPFMDKDFINQLFSNVKEKDFLSSLRTVLFLGVLVGLCF